MWKYLNKGISTSLAIGIIFILVITVAGFTCWQYGEIRNEENQMPEVQIPEKRETAGSSSEFLATEDWKIYRSEEEGFEFRYPNGFSVISGPASYLGGIISINIDGKEYLLDEAAQSGYISFDRDDTNLAACQQTYCCNYTDWKSDNLTKLGLSENKKSGDVLFYRYVSGDADMQASYSQVQYKTFRDGQCYKITLLIRKSSGPYKTYTEGETDKEREERINKILEARGLSDEKIFKAFSQMLSTFRFIEEKEISEVTYPRIVKAYFDPKFSKDIGWEELTFSDSEGNEILKIVGDDNGWISGLNFDQRESVKFYDKAIEYSPGLFYLFLSDQQSCGSGGCSYTFYRFDGKKEKFSNILDFNGFFDYDNSNFSPDVKKIVIDYNWAFGAGNIDGYILIFDFDKLSHIDIKPLDGQNNFDGRIIFTKWLDNDCFEFFSDEQQINGFLKKYYKYCLSLEKLELIKEEKEEFKG